MKVRKARVDDAPVIAGLLGELGYPTVPDSMVARLEALGHGDVVLLGEQGEGLIAVHRIDLLAEGLPIARITALVVAAVHRRRGVAEALLNAAEETCRGWGCELLEVSSGRRPEREDAHRFYRGAGFADAADWSVRYCKRLKEVGAEDAAES